MQKDQFKGKEFKVSSRQPLSAPLGPVTPLPGSYKVIISSPESTDPVTPLSLPKLEKMKQLMEEVLGKEPFCPDETPTESMSAITSLTQNSTAKTTRRVPGYSLYKNSTVTGMQLSICAVTQHMKDYNVIPTHLHVSATLYRKIIEDMKTLYRETCNGKVPFLVGPETIQYIPMSIRDDMPEDTVVCKD